MDDTFRRGPLLLLAGRANRPLAASLDDPARVTPQDHLMVGSRLPWIHMADGLPELEGGHWEHGYPAKD